MYDRQSRQPITLQYLITRTRSSRGGPRSLSMDTDHSIRFSIISISLRDIFPVDRLNQPSSPINRSYLHHRILEYYFIARVVFDNDSSSPPLPFFKRILGLSLHIYIYIFLFSTVRRNHLVLEIKGNAVNRFSVFSVVISVRRNDPRRADRTRRCVSRALRGTITFANHFTTTS